MEYVWPGRPMSHSTMCGGHWATRARALGPSAANAMVAIGIFNIPVFARVTRAAALPLWTLD